MALIRHRLAVTPFLSRNLRRQRQEVMLRRKHMCGLAGSFLASGLVAAPALAQVIYPYPYPYGYPYVAPAPVYVPPPPPPVVVAPAAPAPRPQSWYYCDNPKGYYPYVQNCSGPWREVQAQPPAH
jgi:hypothetical protein